MARFELTLTDFTSAPVSVQRLRIVCFILTNSGCRSVHSLTADIERGTQYGSTENDYECTTACDHDLERTCFVVHEIVICGKLYLNHLPSATMRRINLTSTMRSCEMKSKAISYFEVGPSV